MMKYRFKFDEDFRKDWGDEFILSSMNYFSMMGEIAVDSMYGYSYFDEEVEFTLFNGETYTYCPDNIDKVYVAKDDDSKEYILIKHYKTLDVIPVEDIKTVTRTSIREPYDKSLDTIRNYSVYTDIDKSVREEHDRIHEDYFNENKDHVDKVEDLVVEKFRRIEEHPDDVDPVVVHHYPNIVDSITTKFGKEE